MSGAPYGSGVMRWRKYSWMAAFALALMVHGSVALLFIPDQSLVEIERSAGAKAVVMGSLNAAFAAQSEMPTPEAEEIEAVSDVPDVAPVAPAPLTQPVLEVVAPVEPVDVAPNAVRLAELAEPVKPEEPDEPKPDEMRPPPPEEILSEIKPAAIAPLQYIATLEPTPAEKPTEVKEKPKEKPKKARAEKGKQRKSKSTADSRKGANRTTAKTARSDVAGQGGKRITAGGRAAKSNYIGKVVAKLRRAKRYPSAARAQKAKGVVVVAFTLDASGNLLRARITRSSGYPVLDKAALALVRKVRRYPPIPPEMNRSTMPIVVPLEYLPGRR